MVRGHSQRVMSYVNETLKPPGTIPYIQPATGKEYFVIAENNNKILWALALWLGEFEVYVVDNKA